MDLKFIPNFIACVLSHLSLEDNHRIINQKTLYSVLKPSVMDASLAASTG